MFCKGVKMSNTNRNTKFFRTRMILLLSVLLLMLGHAQDAPTLSTERLQALLTTDIANEPSIPGEIVAVLSPSRSVDVVAAVGVRDVTTGEPLTSNATIRIASVTKTFVAATIMRLVETGVVDLRDSLVDAGLPNDLLEALKADGYTVEQITVQQLLNHSSGIATFLTEPYDAAVRADPTHTWTAQEQIQFALDNFDPVARPGAEYHYSDTAYLLLTQIIEVQTGQPYAAAMRDLLGFERLGLNATYLESLEPVPTDAGPRAVQYMGELRVNDLSPTVDLFGGGGLVSSMHDLAVFFQALVRGEVFEYPDTFRLMSSITASGTESGVASGIFKTEVLGSACWGHTGYWGVEVLTCPDLDVTIAKTYNQVETSLDEARLRDAILAELGIR
jgi:D-alanyl-D-alanine carboxypeptidase